MENLNVCRNCSAPLTGSYCAMCGQKVIGRFNFAYLWKQFHSEMFELDRGLWHTAKDLTLRPGYAIREYLDGKTRVYYSPLKYLLISLTLWYLIFSLVVITDDQVLPDWKQNLQKSLSTTTVGEGLDAFNSSFIAFLVGNLTIYFTVLIPFLALSAWLFFRQLNVVEHVMTIAYLWGHALLWMIAAGILLSPLVLMFDGNNPGISIGLVVVPIFAIFAWFAVAYKQLTGGTFLRTIFKIAAAIWLGYIVFFGLILVVFVLVRAVVRI